MANYAEQLSLTLSVRRSARRGVLRITLDAPASTPSRPSATRTSPTCGWPSIATPTVRVAAHPGRGQGVQRGRQLRAARRAHHRLRRPHPRAARGTRHRQQRHQLLEADRVGHPRPGGGRRPGVRACWPTCRWRVARHASSTATPASASPPATTPPSAGRCCAAWRRRSTTCSPATRSPARRPSASAWCRCASTTTRCRPDALEVAVASWPGMAPVGHPSGRSTP